MIEICDKTQETLQAVFGVLLSVSFIKRKKAQDQDTAPGDNFPHVFLNELETN